MIITEEQKKTLIQYVPDAERLLLEDNLYQLELALDEQIVEHNMDENGELTGVGLKLQLLYDQIYSQN